MKIRRTAVALSFAAMGLLSYTACTAEKAGMREEVRMVSPAIKSVPKKVDGVFATDDHLQAVYFGLNKSKVSPEALEIVKANAEWLKSQPPYLVRIVGYADLRGSLIKNRKLAERRAQALLDAYAASGISKERMSIVAQGTEDPACQPVTEECLKESRRCETLLEDKSLAAR